MRKAESIARYLHRQSQVWLFIHALAILIAIGVADYLTGDELALDPFYAIPILLAVWFGNTNHAIVITVLCAFTWWWADWVSHVYSSEWIGIWNAIVRLMFFSLVMLAGVLLKQQRHSMRARLELLERSLRSEAASRESEARFRILADTAPVMVWMSSTDMLSNFFSKPWLEFTGRTMEQELGNGWLEGVHAEDLQRCLETYGSNFNASRPFTMEYRLRRADGEYRWVLESGVPRYNTPEGEFAGYIGSCIDITSRRQAELELARQRNELKRANEQLQSEIAEREAAQEGLTRAQGQIARIARITTMGELAASIAHELNQPLGSIVISGDACLRWLAAKPSNLEEVRQAVESIIRDGTRASAVLVRIRGLLRRGERLRERLDINDVIREVIALLDGELRRNGASLRTDLPENLPPVVVDRVLLQQVILNLMMNAIEAVRPLRDRTRVLHIRTEEQLSGNIVVFVQDSGVGVDPEHSRRIFEAFYTTKAEGVGMGLTISRSIIEAQGGRLWAVANDGPGSTFCFTLPIAEGTR